MGTSMWPQWVLPIYRPRQFQCTYFGVNPPSGCWLLSSARFQEPLLNWWAHQCWPDEWPNYNKIAYLQAKNFKWPLFGENRPTGCWVPMSTMLREYHAHGHAHVVPTTKWSWSWITWQNIFCCGCIRGFCSCYVITQMVFFNWGLGWKLNKISVKIYNVLQ